MLTGILKELNFKLHKEEATCGCQCMYICKCAFVCVRVFDIPDRPADNKWKCSPSTVFNWSNRPKWARSCCPNNKALCSLSLRSMWNTNTLLHISATTIQQLQLQLVITKTKWDSQPKLTNQQLLLSFYFKIHTLFTYFYRKAHSTLSSAEILPNSRLIAILKPPAAGLNETVRSKVSDAQVKHLSAWAGVRLAACRSKANIRRQQLLS